MEIITPSQLYWITRLDAANTCLTVFFIPAFLLAVAHGVFLIGAKLDTSAFDDKVLRQAGRGFTCSVLVTVISVSISVFIPTTKEAAIIYGVPAIVNNPDIQKKAGKALDDTEELLSALKRIALDKSKESSAKSEADSTNKCETK